VKPLSVTIIAKNEERNIAKALESVSFADEIIVVDSESSDRTCEIARQRHAKVIVRPWPGHVAQKNYAISQATHDWILSIDADEVVSERLAISIKHALEDPPTDITAYRVSRKVWYLGRWIRHCGWYPDQRIRLFRKDKSKWGGIDPHDIVQTDGKVMDLDGDLLHFTYRNMAHHLDTVNKYTTIMATRYYELGRSSRIIDVLFRPPFTFIKKYFFNLGFLDGIPGLVICIIASYYVFLKYAKLWELNNKAPSVPNERE